MHQHRRRSALRDILSLRSRPNASPEERISALRRLRESRRNQSGDVAAGSDDNGSSEDVANVRRSRRISTRLSHVFGSRTRQGQDETAAGHVAVTATPMPTITTASAPAPSAPSTSDPSHNPRSQVAEERAPGDNRSTASSTQSRT